MKGKMRGGMMMRECGVVVYGPKKGAGKKLGGKKATKKGGKK